MKWKIGNYEWQDKPLTEIAAINYLEKMEAMHHRYFHGVYCDQEAYDCLWASRGGQGTAPKPTIVSDIPIHIVD